MTTLTTAHDRRTEDQRKQERRITEAAAVEFVRSGVRRANIDRIAGDAGVSRSTLYRRFPTKDDLVAAVILQLRRDFVRQIGVEIGGLDPRAAAVEGFCLAISELRRNELVKCIVADDPGAIDLVIGFGSPHVEALVGEFSNDIVASLRAAGASMPDEDLRLVAETQFRLITSFALTKSHALDIDDPQAVRRYAEKFLAPMIW
ncbi:TetR/AcrR family transcriptional regulator [Gordonia sp. NPDC003425]